MRSSRSHILRALPSIALLTIVAAFLVAALIGWLAGLTHQYFWDAVGFLLGTLVVSSSLAILACGITLLFARHPRWAIAITAIPLGAVHGYLWAINIYHAFEAMLANFTVPLMLAWMISGMSGLIVGVALIPARAGSSISTRRITIGVSLGILAVVGSCSLVSACLLFFVLDDGKGVTQHVVQHPVSRVTALVIRDDCGATCGCEIRVDLKTDERYLREVYRSWTACAAEATWQSPTELHIIDDDGHEQYIDMHSLGLAR